MTSIFYQHLDKAEGQKLFSESGYPENVVPELERSLSSLNLKSKTKITINCSIDDIFYALKYIPKELSTEVTSKCMNFDPKSSSKNVARIFNVKTAFFLVTSKGNITEQHYRNIVSRLSSAFNTLNIHLPFFIQIGARDQHKYIGKYIENSNIYSYNSHSINKEYNIASLSNINYVLQTEFPGNTSKTTALENTEISARFVYNSITKGKDLTAIFSYPKLPLSDVKDFNVSLASKVYAQLNFTPPEAQESMLKKAIKYASNQATHWPSSPTKSTSAKNLFSKCIPIQCERKLKGALPGGILEQIALTMYNENFTVMWRSFIAFLNEAVAERRPIEVSKSDKNDSLMQQKLNMLNSALAAQSTGKSCYVCRVCDDNNEKLKLETRKLAAVLPTTTYERLEEIGKQIIDFRGVNEFATYDRFITTVESDDNKAISAMWDAIPPHLTDTADGIREAMNWFSTLTPAEVHAEMILILVACEVRKISNGAETRGAFAQQALARTVSKAIALEQLARLQAPLDFLKAADDIANIIVSGTIGIEMLRNVTTLFPGANDFIDALVRNGFAMANNDARERLSEVVNGKSGIKFVKSIEVTVTGKCDDEQHRVFIAAENRKTVVGVTSVRKFM